MSPTLFVIAIKNLAVDLNNSNHNKIVINGTEYSHSMISDDSQFLVKDFEAERLVMNILSKYEKASNALVKLQKSFNKPLGATALNQREPDENIPWMVSGVEYKNLGCPVALHDNQSTI